MDLSYRWLQSMVPGLSLSPAELADLLAGLGAPIDDVVRLDAELGDVVVARVLASERHPNADRLSLCRVDAGGEPLSVVCGANNVRVGSCYPFAPVGATLPGGVKIRKAKIRGEFSQGMLCSERELGLGRDHAGIMELAGEYRPGQQFVEALGLDDVRIVADVTPNRPDLLSHLGFAREIGAALSLALDLPPFPGSAAPQDGPHGESGPALELALETGPGRAAASGIEVVIQDGDLCPRYIGAIIRGVHIGPSPEWLKTRLRAIGLRPVNNVVDATNYVLYEVGQPLHAFDLARVGGERVVVRRALPDESITTLDGRARGLGRDMLVIADSQRAMAVAGVMGGLDSEVSQATTDVLVECALFAPRSIRATRRTLELVTDASFRFERGVDPAGMERALRRVLTLIRLVAGGRIEAIAADACARPWQPPVVRLRPSRATHVLGVAVSAEAIHQYLTPLGFEARGTEGDALLFQVPGHRAYDVSREIDLIEEVARRHGYENMPDTLQPARPGTVPDDPMARLEDRLRVAMVGRGLLEAHSGALAGAGEGDVALLKPLSSAETRLRRALLPGLLHRLEHNFAHGTRDVRLFEIGTGFAPGGADDLPRETRRLGVVLTGARRPLHWSGAAPDLDLWDARGLLEQLAADLGGDDLEIIALADTDSAAPGYLDPARCFALRRRTDVDAPLGLAGAIADGALDAPPWAAPAFGLEVVLDQAMAASPRHHFVPLPAFPAVDRDIALLVPDGVAAASVTAAIRSAAGAALETVFPFDVFRSDAMEAGQRSIAFRLRFRSAERTLTDEEVDAAMAGIMAALQEELHVIVRQ